jgi:hypothetical protein
MPSPKAAGAQRHKQETRRIEEAWNVRIQNPDEIPILLNF